MKDWRTRLENWVHVWGQLEELTRDCFPVNPAADAVWPAGLPACPALSDFYARCDGGTFGPYELAPLAELTDPSSGWLAGSPGLELKPGCWLEFGSHEYGHALLWAADIDEVLLYSPNDEETRRSKRTMEEFLGRLFLPSAKASNETCQLWAEALTEAEQVANPRRTSDEDDE
jgi:hypothetical protein